MEKGVRRSSRKLDPEARVIVDAFGTLYLIGIFITYIHINFIFYIFHIFLFTDVSTEEEGNYTCYVNNVNMLQVKVIVISKARLLTQGEIKTL